VEPILRTAPPYTECCVSPQTRRAQRPDAPIIDCAETAARLKASLLRRRCAALTRATGFPDRTRIYRSVGGDRAAPNARALRELSSSTYRRISTWHPRPTDNDRNQVHSALEPRLMGSYQDHVVPYLVHISRCARHGWRRIAAESFQAPEVGPGNWRGVQDELGIVPTVRSGRDRTRSVAETAVDGSTIGEPDSGHRRVCSRRQPKRSL
jgi:hypothetical protein